MRLVLSALIALFGATALQAQDALRVIVNPSVPGASIDRKALADIYLKRVSRWSSGMIIEPIDQSAGAPLRTRFSPMVFSQPTVWVTTQWLRQMTERKGFPPAVKTSDQDVIAYVAKTKGAIGYVGVDPPLDETVKVLKFLE